jgi:hypothetical protein
MGGRGREAGEEVIGRRSGLTDRAIESVGSGRVEQAEMGRLGQKGFGLLNYLGQPATIKLQIFSLGKIQLIL